MKIMIWYLMVVVDGILLIMSLAYGNIYFTVLSFTLALVLNRFKKKIPMPEELQRLIKSNNK